MDVLSFIGNLGFVIFLMALTWQVIANAFIGHDFTVWVGCRQAWEYSKNPRTYKLREYWTRQWAARRGQFGAEYTVRAQLAYAAHWFAALLMAVELFGVATFKLVASFF